MEERSQITARQLYKAVVINALLIKEPVVDIEEIIADVCHYVDKLLEEDG